MRIDGTSGRIDGSMRCTRRPSVSRTSMITLEKQWASLSSYLRYLMPRLSLRGAVVFPTRCSCPTLGRQFSEHAVLLVDLAEQPSLQQLVARMVLACCLAERLFEHL